MRAGTAPRPICLAEVEARQQCIGQLGSTDDAAKGPHRRLLALPDAVAQQKTRKGVLVNDRTGERTR
jgi:hypothetical protein